MAKPKFQAVKGTRDILPPDSALWNRVEQTAREVFATYNFGEIRLPIFEDTEVFARAVGQETDIVSKEMYSFEDRGGDSISLRPEATASVCRAYIQHGMKTLPGDVRLYYMGPMFRRERPQKGRYRQFYQIGAEVLGQSDHPAIDAEVIEMVMVFIARCGLEGCKLAVNSIGCPDCRPAYVKKLQGELRRVESKLGPDSRRRIETNPLRVLDSKVKEEQEIIAALPTIADHLCDECKSKFDGLQQELKARDIEFTINPRLVRGLDYYRRTTFEITAPGLGSQDAVCGGGRYDGLMEMLGGPPTKGIGFSLGTDRLILALQETGISVGESVDVLIAYTEAELYGQALNFAGLLRKHKLNIEVAHKAMNPRKALGLASKRGIPIGVVVGPDEISAGTFSVRFLRDGERVSLGRQQIAKHGYILLFRVLLESAFVQLAEHYGIDHKNVPPSRLALDLSEKGILPNHLLPIIKSAFSTMASVVHGRETSEDDTNRAIAEAIYVLHILSTGHPQILWDTRAAR